MPLLFKPHRVLAPGEVIEADPRCQQAIQNSTTLAYCGLLIRRGALELARQVLQVLAENKTAAFRGELAYLQAWTDLEAKNFRAAKSLLLSRVEAQPGDAVALSLLQACLVLEIDHNASRSQNGDPEVEAPSTPADLPDSRSNLSIENPSAKSDPAIAPAHADHPYQSVLSDPQTRGLVLWEPGGVESKIFGPAEFEPLAAALPELFPQAVSPIVAELEGGVVTKICFAFEKRTVTTWHGGDTHVGLWTGPLPQSLLAMTRVEKIFRQQTAGKERDSV